jgi:N-acetylmuramoyl-L-alanine amidase
MHFLVTILAAAMILAELQAPAVAAEQGAFAPGAVDCLAEAVYFEAKGTGETGALAVASVIKNRRASGKFPDTICAVVEEGCQFSYRCDGKPENLGNATERRRAYRAAEAVLEGEVRDPTEGALFFHSANADPGWFSTRPRTGEIGGNVFYR